MSDGPGSYWDVLGLWHPIANGSSYYRDEFVIIQHRVHHSRKARQRNNLSRSLRDRLQNDKFVKIDGKEKIIYYKMNKKHNRIISANAICLLAFMAMFCFRLPAQIINKSPTKILTVSLNVNDSDGVIYNDRSIPTFLEIQNHTDDTLTFIIEWLIETDDQRPLKQVSVSSKVKGHAIVKAFCPLFIFPGPGFFKITGTLTLQAGEQYKASKVIGVDPEKITAQLNPQADFLNFWTTSLKELESVAPEFKVIPVERNGKTRSNLFKVEMKSFGGLIVRGWLEEPKKPGKYPALIRVPGYTGNMEPIDKYDDLIVLSFNPRDHGESDNSGERSYAMWVRGMESKENYFYRGLYLDCIRAVDFIMTRNDVDRNRIAIWGGSQGGGLSFATAALDKRINLCIADIPFLCDWQKYFEVTHWDEMDDWFAQHPTATWTSVLKTLSYYDTKNMAGKITCPVIMDIGLQDDVCPPATSFATYNLIRSKKEYSIYKNEGHHQPDGHYENRFLRLRKIFKMN